MIAERAWWEWQGWHPEQSRVRRRATYLLPFIRRFGVSSGLRVAKQLRLVEFNLTPDATAVAVPGWDSPIWLRPETVDAGVFRQQLLAGEMDIDLPFTPRFIFDGGANIGIVSRLFARKWPAAEIAAVEPELANFRMLEKNVVGLTRVHPIRAALWDRAGVVNLGSEDQGSTGFRTTNEGDGVQVPARTIDEIADSLGWNAIDVVKLDIEGAERQVLSSSADWLDRVRCLAIELHDRFAPGCTEAFERAINPKDWSITTHGEYLIAIRRS